MSVATSTGGRFDLKCGQRALADILALIAVNCRGPNSGAIQMLHDFIGSVLRAGEYDRARECRILQKVRQQMRLVPLFDKVDRLLDQLNRRGHWSDLDVQWVAQPLGGQLANLGRHRGREHQRLPLLGNRGDDLSQRNDEAHVEHLIRFVEDEDLNIAKIDVPLFHQVE